MALLLTCVLLLLFWGALTIWVATGFSVAGIVVSLAATIAIVSAITMALWFLFRVLYQCVRWVVDQF